ncbi:unnamed protein product [Effrenium voratum]|nr:unnamed protein product [Effrenium voratum]
MDDLAHVSFVNTEFLQKNGLTVKNVLDYFFTSPFYLHFGGATSLNEQRRRGQIEDPSASEFVLLAANEDAKEGRVETSVFVIQRRSTVPHEAFYVISGSVYKAPEISELMGSALCQAALSAAGILKKQLEAMRQKELPDLPSEGRLESEPSEPSEPTWPAWCLFETKAPPAWLLAEAKLAAKVPR